MKKTLTAIAIAAAAALTLSACATGEQTMGGGDRDDRAVVIGSADFAESQLIATIYAVALDDAGVTVRDHFGIGSREVYLTALQDGSIDLVPEYAGSLVKYLDPESQATTSDEVLTALDAALPTGLTHLAPSEAQNRDTLTVTAATAQQYGLTTISDLVPHASGLALGGPPEWLTRANGVPGLERVYGLTFREYVTLDAGGPLTLGALRGGQIQVGNVFSTDPAIASEGLVSLEDDKSLFPAQNVVPLLSDRISDERVTATLDAVSAALTTEALIALNGRVVAGEDMREVARAWLAEAGIGS